MTATPTQSHTAPLASFPKRAVTSQDANLLCGELEASPVSPPNWAGLARALYKPKPKVVRLFLGISLSDMGNEHAPRMTVAAVSAPTAASTVEDMSMGASRVAENVSPQVVMEKRVVDTPRA